MSLDGQVDNTFLPVTPAGYSDNVGMKSFSFDLEKELLQLVFLEGVNNPDTERVLPQEIRDIHTKGIEPLTYRDALATGYLEGKIYARSSLREGFHNMENGLIAKDVNNTAKGRSNMSFKFVGSSGKMGGYLLAYETPDSVYIADFAADPQERFAGGRLLREFIYQYTEKYVLQGNFKPITAEARDRTSFRILEKQIKRINKESDFEWIYREEGAVGSGESMRHKVSIEVRKKRNANSLHSTPNLHFP